MRSPFVRTTVIATVLLAASSAFAGTTASTTTITASATTGTYGTATGETFTVKLVGKSGSGHTTGTVAITGSGVLGALATITTPTNCTASNGYTYTCTATATLPATTPAGAYTITASYGGNATYAASSGTATVTIAPIASTAALSASTGAYGAAITLNATNTGSNTGAAPTGVPTFVVGGTTAGGTPTCTSATHIETCTLSYTLPPALTGSANYATSVSFAADTNYTAATATSTLAVTLATPTATADNATGHYLGAAALAETNTGVGSAYAAPTGALTVKVGGITQTRGKNCTGATDVDSCAANYTIRASQTTANTYTIVATFAADSNYAASTASGTLTVTLDNSKTTVTATPANPTPAGTVVLAATVKNSSHGALTPTGGIAFTTPSATLGNCTLAAATCSITVSASQFASGASTKVTAAYGGLTNDIAASNGTVLVTPGAEIVFTSVTHTFGSVPVGGSATYGVQLTNNDASAFPFAISLTGSPDFTQQSNCGTSVAAGAKCEIVFTYKPTSSATETATWSLTAGSFTFSPSNGGTLTATGITTAGVTLTTDGHNFGYQFVTTISDVFGAVLTNGTASPITLTFAPQTDTTDFITYANNCPATLAAYQTCNLQYEFAPQSLGTVSNFVGISATQGGSPIAITAGGVTATGITLTGTGD